MTEIFVSSDKDRLPIYFKKELLQEEVLTPEQWVNAIHNPRLHEILSTVYDRRESPEVQPELTLAEFEEAKQICDALGIPSNSYTHVISSVYSDVKLQREREHPHNG